MSTPGFGGAPVCRTLSLGLLTLSVSIAIFAPDLNDQIQSSLTLSSKPSPPPLANTPAARPSPLVSLLHLLIVAFIYPDAATGLLQSLTFYHLRVVERLWGSRKFASTAALCFAIGQPLTIAFAYATLAVKTAILGSETAEVVVYPGPIVPLLVLVMNYLSTVVPAYWYRILLGLGPPAKDVESSQSKPAEGSGETAQAVTVSSHTLVWMPVVVPVLLSSFSPMVATCAMIIFLGRMGGSMWRFPSWLWPASSLSQPA